MKFFCNNRKIGVVICALMTVGISQKHLCAQVPIKQGSPDVQILIEQWQREGHKGNAAAQNNLGVVYREGRTVPQDYNLSARWFYMAAKQGYPISQFNLGIMYSRGLGVPQDSVVAVEWFRRAAVQGDVNAQYNLAQAYAKGAGIDLDLEAAMKWYSAAAKQGDEIALRNLQVVRAYAAKTVLKNVKQPASTIKANVDRSPVKQVLLKAKNASRVLPSKEKAPSTAKKIPSVLLQNLSIRKKPEGSVPKITQVSPDRFEVGLNAFQKANYAKARLVWTKLAKDGDPDAQYNLANMYRTGRGGASDLKLALKYYTLAARKGLRLAQFNLGNIIYARSRRSAEL